MNKHCTCNKKVTRNFVEAHNNKCPQCGKRLISPVDFEQTNPQFEKSDEQVQSPYNNVNNKSQLGGIDNLSFIDYSGEATTRHHCVCLTPPSEGQFCPECGGLLIVNQSPSPKLVTNSKTISNFATSSPITRRWCS